MLQGTQGQQEAAPGGSAVARKENAGHVRDGTEADCDVLGGCAPDGDVVDEGGEDGTRVAFCEWRLQRTHGHPEAGPVGCAVARKGTTGDFPD